MVGAEGPVVVRPVFVRRWKTIQPIRANCFIYNRIKVLAEIGRNG